MKARLRHQNIPDAKAPDDIITMRRSELVKAAEQIANDKFDELRHDLIKENINTTFRIVLQTVMLVMIDDFGWGGKEVKGKPSRIRRLIEAVRDRMEYEIDRYDDSYDFALGHQLRERGVDCEIVLFEEDKKK